jgi:hypothetical protein
VIPMTPDERRAWLARTARRARAMAWLAIAGNIVAAAVNLSAAAWAQPSAIPRWLSLAMGVANLISVFVVWRLQKSVGGK